MKGTDFNLATSILFVGYLIMQLPSNLSTSSDKCHFDSVVLTNVSSYYEAEAVCILELSHDYLGTHNNFDIGGRYLSAPASNQILPRIC